MERRYQPEFTNRGDGNGLWGRWSTANVSTLNTWVTVLNVTGGGVLNDAFVRIGSASSGTTVRILITLDGDTYEASRTCNSGECGIGLDTVTPSMVRDSWGTDYGTWTNSYNYPGAANLTFDDNLKIEVQTNKATLNVRWNHFLLR
jgi:hypothetical protein